MKKQSILLTLSLMVSQMSMAATGVLIEANVKSMNEENIKVVSQMHTITLIKKNMNKDVVEKMSHLVGERKRIKFIAPIRAIASMEKVTNPEYDPQDVHNKDR